MDLSHRERVRDMNAGRNRSGQISRDMQRDTDKGCVVCVCLYRNKQQSLDYTETNKEADRSKRTETSCQKQIE